MEVWVRNKGGTPIIVDAAIASNGTVREQLTASRTYYVRTSTAANPGSDSNTGLTNDAAGAFLTIQHAVNEVASIDLGIYSVNIQVTGNSTEAVVLKSYLGTGPASLLGDGAANTRPNVTIAPTSGNAILANGVIGLWQVIGVKVGSTANGYGIASLNGSNLNVSFCEFGSVNSAQTFSHLFCLNATITRTNQCWVSGGAFAHVQVDKSGVVNESSIEVDTVTGITVSKAWSYVTTNSLHFSFNMTYTGIANVTGQKFFVDMNSCIDQINAVSTTKVFPGTVAGFADPATGGVYRG
jgi:hypothetical protein